jgi:hypothetical protein
MKRLLLFVFTILQEAQVSETIYPMRMEAEKLKWLNLVMNTVTCRLQANYSKEEKYVDPTL